ncbi:hypothetical protein [Leptolyngbya sp. GGD]|uniref:hypothetical protein n=1 Tax=Leptolyngbya sp. GGD TaxID=2997907 RepID=UPI00227A7AA8|nr:hypothetical protein [Leptolyngbya sp. GGD]MCY6494266.1 hypothetical protein [Leptolyngbya sp. GGD]
MNLQPTSTETERKDAPKPVNFDWKTWEVAPSSNDQVCRESQGNLVCLDAQTAQRLGWR